MHRLILILLLLLFCAHFCGSWLTMSSPSTSSRSPLAHRSPSQIRQARNTANLPLYMTTRPNAVLRNAGVLEQTRQDRELDAQRTAHRDADRERQISLQETPSRRRRRMPEGQENRVPSPTPAARRPFPQPDFAGVGTPPQSQPAPISKAAAAQRARRERERQAAMAGAPPVPRRPLVGAPAVLRRSVHMQPHQNLVNAQLRQREHQHRADGPCMQDVPRDLRTASQQDRRGRERRELEQQEREQHEREQRELGRREREGMAESQQRQLQPRPAQRQLLTPPATQQAGARPPRERPIAPQLRPIAPRPAQGTQHAAPLARRPYVEPVARHDLGPMNVKCRRCGALHWMAEKLAASSQKNPEFGKCCLHGKVSVPTLQEPPAELQALFIGNNAQAKEFRKNIAQYNVALSFTSLGVAEDRSINNGGGPPIFRIHGDLCHRTGALLPSEGQRPVYAQLYFYEPQAALDHRMQSNSNLRRDTMEILQRVITENHQYAPLYKHAYEILAPCADDVSVRLRVAPGVHARRGNLPTVDEVAVLLPEQQNTESRDIILRRRDGPLLRISDLHPAYTPLFYVLLFPYGENGWHSDLRLDDPEKDNPGRLTQTTYVAYRLFQREDEASTILRGCRLLQRYMVDMWASADQNRLNYLRFNQNTLRAELYSGLEDAVHAGDEDLDLENLGKRVVLPSSYVGGPRDRAQRFQDSMAIARYYRTVDIFMTVTTNPDWPEITRELLPGQQPADRPDLVARVFQMKKEAIMEDISKHGVFGRAVAYVYAIEFQKRGLPHMHLLLFLEPGQKLLTPEEIDSAISARWPNPETEPLLFETVKRCMVHGPCGAANLNSPCMENGRCTKRYPKAFTDHTVMDENGYPQYYRPNDGRAYDVRGIQVDNSWIIAYNPWFSAKYNCHINVECAVSLGSFKYAFKYIQKGGDVAGLELRNKNDEIERWIQGRYVSAAEAAWRIFHFGLYMQEPSVVRLQIHLPGQHLVLFDPNEDPETMLARAATERTLLTAFFEANADNGALGQLARRYTYQEFPQAFVWKNGKNEKRWAMRRRGFSLGRMYFVPPNAGERFYLRTLLTVVKGPRSFADLRTYNGITYATFLEACLARGLLEDDGEWHQCLSEASQMQTGSRLRQLFATLLLFCEPTRPAVLWTEFREHICDDLAHRLRTMGRNPSEDDVYDYGLYLLDKLLQESGRFLKEWPTMSLPQINWNVEVVNPLIAEQLAYNVNSERERAEQQKNLLNLEQRAAFDEIVSSVRERSGKMYFLNGPGGTGKTFVYKTVCHSVRADAEIVLCVASSGIAALLMPGGRTAYSVFKIPIDGLSSESFCNIPKNSQRADLLRRTVLIIWDEIGMQDRLAVEAVDRTLRDLLNDARPFGGITVVLGGDFQQILPVVPRGSREAIVQACVLRSPLWANIKVLRLHQNMRLASGGEDEREFASWLLDIGHGRGAAASGSVALRPGMQCPSSASLIDFIYPGISSTPPPPPEYFLNRMILAPRNADVFEINDTVLTAMAGEAQTYFSADKVMEEAGADGPARDDTLIPVEFLRSLNSGSLPPGELSVKVGCPLILLRNLSPTRGLCNGTRMVVLRMSDRVLECRLVGGDHDGETALIPRISLTPSNTTDFAFKFTRRQFPVRLAFALTINKAQGQSVKFVGLDLRVPVFSHGQLYVAFSRATSGQRIRVLLPDNNTTGAAANVVYPEVLLD